MYILMQKTDRKSEPEKSDFSDGVYKIRCQAVTGRHALYFVTELPVEGWTRDFFEPKTLFELEDFTFFK